ncbi:MAG: hypothetical protein KDC98_12205, partial [Planctomycetes bacterium]|nr:hypothetical protein [Planctomycetota bacterium]
GSLSDADFALSTDATLGAIDAAPTLLSSTLLEITLGVGVGIEAGVSTITWSSENDLVRSAIGIHGTAGSAVVIGHADGSLPVLSNVTIAAIDRELNGTGPAGGMLQVAPNGWALDLAFSDATAVDHVTVIADVAVHGPSGSLPAGTDLQAVLTVTNATPTTASYRVPSGVTFPQGEVTLRCAAIDASGLASTPKQFDVRIKNFTDALRPFETAVNGSQVWYLDFERDQESFGATPTASAATATAFAGSNGRSDFVDLLHIVGLNRTPALTDVSAGKDSNEVVQDMFKQSLLTELAAFYSGANVTFTLQQPNGSFGNSTSVPYSSLAYSRISIGGSPTSPGTLGVAIFDPKNETQDDNTLFDYQGSRLGIFLFTIVEAGMAEPSSCDFRLAFDPLAPALGGLAVGADTEDRERLQGTKNDPRTTEINTAIDELARFTAVVLAHECGHSMGLVENGPMPNGLYGNDTINFPGSLDGHIRNTSLFPSGATNVMSPALSYSATLHPSTGFNSLNMAYLREQVFYGN